MGLPNRTNSICLLETPVLILLCFYLEFCSCRDTITNFQFINDTETLLSNGGIFKLGFFSPVNTTHRYLGIMYNIPLKTVVWVANRDRPLNDSTGTLTISDGGNLIVLDGDQNIIWSTNISNSNVNSSAQILDTGNLVLRDDSNGRILWESFEHPTDSFLNRMTLSTSVNRGENMMLTSWKSPSDPSTGKFSLGLVPLNIPQIFVWNGSEPFWRSGPWNGQIFIGIPTMESLYLNGFSLVDDRQGTASISYNYANEYFRYYISLNSEGTFSAKSLSAGREDWEVSFSAPIDECEKYGKCRPFGRCYSLNSPICNCLRGFEPNNIEEWNIGNWTSGCVRRTELRCDRNSSIDEEDGFLELTSIKVPDFAELSNVVEDNCGSMCLNNCSCRAYAFYVGIGCMHWSDSLIDIQQFPSGGATLYIRVAYSDLDKDRRQRMTLVIAITVIIGSISIGISAYFLWRYVEKRKINKHTRLKHESTPRYAMKQVKLEKLPLFTFSELANATEKFHSANKLGEGGFGPVYKGKLPNGQQIAVKRLSRSSGQGLKEFMNEVVVISKLQHRNLVRILGVCVEREEKMLVYEYMPNRSLDALLFDSRKQELEWSKRINIIEGICRGLLYLHRDSRLRIIHRDLKASNILLDEELNAKISDFGMARIFGGNQDQAKTKRVVGTYGYMAPEYAMGGRFSEKSDVFGFGVLLLEIVSGRRNTSFHDDDNATSLLGLAWKLWNEGQTLELADERISDLCFQTDMMRYIHVGLLCVQDLAKDRPAISIVLSMLCSEIVDLPSPKQPAFTGSQISSGTIFSQQNNSVNDVTVTVVEGR